MGNIGAKFGLNSNYKSLTKDVIRTINLTEFNKLVLRKRYVQMMEQLDKKRATTRLWYGIFTFIITLGSILVPAFISIEDKTLLLPSSTNKTTYYNLNENTEATSSNNITNIIQPEIVTHEEIQEFQNHILFWTTFIISLMVTICNALMKLYSIDKIYIIRHLKYDELRREGWFFYTLTGEYAKYNTNDEAFRLFITRIEAIKSMLLHDELTPEYNISNVPELRDSIDLEGNTGNTRNTGNGGNREEENTEEEEEQEQGQEQTQTNEPSGTNNSNRTNRPNVNQSSV